VGIGNECAHSNPQENKYVVRAQITPEKLLHALANGKKGRSTPYHRKQLLRGNKEKKVSKLKGENDWASIGHPTL